MIQNILYFSLIIIIVLLVARVLFSRAKAPTARAMTKAEKIDPMDPAAGDFLAQDQIDLVKQAQDFYNKGDYYEAARGYLYALQYNPGDIISIYNLACCYGLLNNAELAAKYLKLAIKSGFYNVNQVLFDKDFESVKDHEVFRSVLESIPLVLSQDTKTKGAILRFDTHSLFKCRVHLPQNYDKTKSYPLVIGLHGYGNSADNFVENYGKFENPQFIFAAPSAPYHFSMGNRIAYSWHLLTPDDMEFPGRNFHITEDYIIDLIKALRIKYNIGDIYLLGHSQGGATAYMIGIKHHENFKGLIPIAGAFNPNWIDNDAITAGNGLKILIVHGKDDRIVAYREGTAAKIVLSERGYDVDFIDFEGGHDYPPDNVVRKIQRWIEG